MAKKFRRVAAKNPRTDAQRQADQQIHDEGPNDPDINRQGRKAKQELQARQRRFGDVMVALKESRVAAGLSLADMEERTGISKSSLSQLENGKGNPTIETLERIAKAIGVKLTIMVTA